MADAVIYGSVPGLAFHGDTVHRVAYDAAPACDREWDNGRLVCRLPRGHATDHLPCPADLVWGTGLRFLADGEMPA
jgi:hypothetical protein